MFLLDDRTCVFLDVEGDILENDRIKLQILCVLLRRLNTCSFDAGGRTSWRSDWRIHGSFSNCAMFATSFTDRLNQRHDMAEQSAIVENSTLLNCAEGLPGNAQLDGGVSDYAVFVFTSFLQKLATSTPLSAWTPQFAPSIPTTALRRSKRFQVLDAGGTRFSQPKRFQVPDAGGTRFSQPNPVAAVYNSSSTQVQPKLRLCLCFP